ncbi:DNA cytosine methyltransferase [Shouchella hunanensis]|uniref:Cytosine-specific methyltransferase n=1 Tax=Shouchella hunanensis TaxID=766894 RepID=A0ABY7WBP0_9BACI|nr:DNA (cytosine-5-)-methyltransferase [Shouchella hunanensis]WDF05536.1 DNA (cytosine-5-)-methyltransferase [Shouchella hunanensis]
MYRVVSLFSGCGGGDIGLHGGFTFLDHYYEPLNYQTIFANEINTKISNLFKANFNIQPIEADIREVENSSIPEHELLVGGFPCVSFSMSAQNPPRLGINNDLSGKLFYEMVKILKDKQPKAFIAENVKGLLSANKGKALPLIINEFKKAGYNVKYEIINSADYGVPQKRYRIFIVGIRNDLDFEYQFPEPTHFPADSFFEPKYTRLTQVIFEEDDIDEKYYFSQKAIDGMLRAKKDMNKGRAQNINQPCNTVGAHLAKVSLNSTDPVLNINGRFRRFTPREVARIQSFPESYQLTESEGTQYIGLGNAIPPVVMWHIAKSLRPLFQNDIIQTNTPMHSFS